MNFRAVAAARCQVECCRYIKGEWVYWLLIQRGGGGMEVRGGGVTFQWKVRAGSLN